MPNKGELFDKIYEEPQANPWYRAEASEELKELIESGKVKPCKAVELACRANSR